MAPQSIIEILEQDRTPLADDDDEFINEFIQCFKVRPFEAKKLLSLSELRCLTFNEKYQFADGIISRNAFLHIVQDLGLDIPPNRRTKMKKEKAQDIISNAEKGVCDVVESICELYINKYHNYLY